MKRYWKLIACMLVLTVLIAGCGEKVVAKVNGKKITEKDFNTRIEQVILTQFGYDLESEQGKDFKETYQKEFLENMINEELLFQDATKRKIALDEKKLEEAMKQIKANFSTEKAYQEQLKTLKITEKELKDSIRRSMLIQGLFDELTKDITTPSTDPKNYYNENKAKFVIPETVDVRHILVKTEEEAKQVIALLDKGEDFTKLVSEKSVDPGAKGNQGLYKNVSMDGNYYEEFKVGAFSLKEVGKYTKEAVKSPVGYHIIKLEGREKEKQQTYDEVKDQLLQDLLNADKDKKFDAYLTELQKNAKIERSLPEKKEQKADEKKDTTPESNEKTEPSADDQNKTDEK